MEMTERDARRLRLNRRNAKRFMVCHDGLFRRTNSGLRAIPPLEARGRIIRAFHDEIGYWDLETTKRFVLDRYWWPTVHQDVNGYVRGCDGCQKARQIPGYKNTLRFPMTSLFHTYSVDFAGLLPRTPTGNKCVLVAIEHLTGWPIARATESSTAEEVLRFMKEEMIYCFGLPRGVVSDNATCFKASVLDAFMARNGINWKTVLAYAPMSNGRAERMVGTLKRAIHRVILGSTPGRTNWDQALLKVLYGYRRRKMVVGLSPFELLYGVLPRMEPGDKEPLFGISEVRHREMELLHSRAMQAMRITGRGATPLTDGRETSFNVGEEVLVVKRAALGNMQKWPIALSKFYGPCRVVRARHPRYTLVSPHQRYSKRDIHARRLVLYKRPPAHLH